MSTIPPEYDTAYDHKDHEVEDQTPDWATTTLDAVEDEPKITSRATLRQSRLRAFEMSSDARTTHYVAMVYAGYRHDPAAWSVIQRKYDVQGPDIVVTRLGPAGEIGVIKTASGWERVTCATTHCLLVSCLHRLLEETPEPVTDSAEPIVWTRDSVMAEAEEWPTLSVYRACRADAYEAAVALGCIDDIKEMLACRRPSLTNREEIIAAAMARLKARRLEARRLEARMAA